MKLYKNSIPVGNIYYMLAYAFRDLTEQGIVSVRPEEFDNTAQLMAEIIIRGVSYQLKKGLFRGYESCTDELSSVRGRINMSETVNRCSHIRRKIVCDYDEYTDDTLLNRILRSTMLLLIRSDIKPRQVSELRRLVTYFGQVSDIALSEIRWNSLSYDRNSREYRLLMSVCRIICENMLHSTENGDMILADFGEENLPKLYEKFILNYFAVHHKKLSPASSEIKWAFSESGSKLFPKMQSDIMLTNGNRRLIIDAKFYSHTTVQNYGKHSVHSHNLYQLFTYVMNESAAFSGDVSGMLLYAKTDDDVIPSEGLSVNICGKAFAVRSLDLRGDFDSICRQLDSAAALIK